MAQKKNLLTFKMRRSANGKMECVVFLADHTLSLLGGTRSPKSYGPVSRSNIPVPLLNAPPSLLLIVRSASSLLPCSLDFAANRQGEANLFRYCGNLGVVMHSLLRRLSGRHRSSLPERALPMALDTKRMCRIPLIWFSGFTF